MPVYSYACHDCGHGFDQRQSLADPALTVCPRCEGALHKVFSAVGVVFKGSGFYRTDSRRKSASSARPTSATRTAEPVGVGATPTKDPTPSTPSTPSTTSTSASPAKSSPPNSPK